MEKHNQSEAIKEFSHRQFNSVANCFQSEEDMKSYYLHMADTMNASLFFERRSDYISLAGLHRKLKQFNSALQLLSTHEWSRSIAEIQNACGVFMLQNDVEKKRLLRTNEEIGLHLQFITELAGNMSFLKQLLGILNCHHQNVGYLLRKMKEQVQPDDVEV